MQNNYNSQRSKLTLPEYGRHVHQMVAYLRTIEDRAQRNEQALLVIDVMGNLNQTIRDSEDFRHKLWDHLFIIADFDLDVDSPYPIPLAEEVSPTPQRLPYPGTTKMLRKHYGKYIEQMFREVGRAPAVDPELREEVAVAMVRYLRIKAQEFCQGALNNEVILNDVSRMSESTIEVSEEVLGSLRTEHKQVQMGHRSRKGFSAKGGAGGGKSGGRSYKAARKAGKNSNQNSKRKSYSRNSFAK